MPPAITRGMYCSSLGPCSEVQGFSFHHHKMTQRKVESPRERPRLDFFFFFFLKTQNFVKTSTKFGENELEILSCDRFKKKQRNSTRLQ